MTKDEIITMLGGQDAVDRKIRKLAMKAAEMKHISVDELLDSVCCSEGPGYVTTYREAYTAAYLEGVEEGLAKVGFL